MTESGRIRLHRKLFLGIAGVDKSLIKDLNTDQKIYSSIGFIMLLLWVLMFFLQYHAFATILHLSPFYFHLIVSFLTSTTIIFAERILIITDTYLEGELEFHKNNTHHDLKRIQRSRYINVFVRGFSAIIISYATIHFALPSIFSAEIQSELHKKDMAENEGVYNRIDDKQKRSKEDLLSTKNNIQNLKKSRQKLASLLGTSEDASNQTLEKIEELRAGIAEDKNTALNARICAEAEEQGQSLKMCSGGTIEPSGKRGCSSNCKMWKSVAIEHEQSAKTKEKEIQTLKNDIKNIESGIKDPQSAYNIKISDIKDQISDIDDEISKEEKKQNQIKQEESSIIPDGPIYNNVKDNQGIISKFDAIDTLFENMSFRTEMTIWLLFLFLLSVETTAIAMKSFSQSGAYALRVYLKSKAKKDGSH